MFSAIKSITPPSGQTREDHVSQSLIPETREANSVSYVPPAPEKPPAPPQDDSFRLPINTEAPDTKQVEFESSEAGQILLGMIAEQNADRAAAEADRVQDELPPETERMKSLLARKDSLQNILTTCLENPVDDEAVCLADKMGVSVFEAQKNKEAIRKLSDASRVNDKLDAEKFIRQFPGVAEQILARPEDVQVLRNNFSVLRELFSRAGQKELVTQQLRNRAFPSDERAQNIANLQNFIAQNEKENAPTLETVSGDTIPTGTLDRMKRAWKAGAIQADIALLGKKASDAAYTEPERLPEIMRQVAELKRQADKAAPAPSDSYMTTALTDAVSSIPLSASIVAKGGATAAIGGLVGAGVGAIAGAGGVVAGALSGAKIGAGLGGVVGLGAFAQPAEEGSAFLEFYGAETPAYLDDNLEVQTRTVDAKTAAVAANHHGHISAMLEGGDTLATLLTAGLLRGGNSLARRVGRNNLKKWAFELALKDNSAALAVEKAAEEAASSAARKAAKTAAVSTLGEVGEEVSQQASQIYFRREAMEKTAGRELTFDNKAAAEEIVSVIPSAFLMSLPMTGAAPFLQTTLTAAANAQRKNTVRALARADSDRLKILADLAEKNGPEQAALVVQRFNAEMKTASGAPFSHVTLDAQDAIEFIARNADDVQAAATAAFEGSFGNFAGALQNGGTVDVPLETFVRGFASLKDENGVTLGQFMADKVWLGSGMSAEQARAEIELENRIRKARTDLLASEEEITDAALAEYIRMSNDEKAAERFQNGRRIVDLLAPRLVKGNITEEQTRTLIAPLVALAMETDDAAGGHANIALGTLRAIVEGNPDLFEGKGYSRDELLEALESLKAPAEEANREEPAEPTTAIQLASSVQSPKEKLEELHADNERRKSAVDTVVKHQEALRIAGGNPSRAAIVEHIQELQADPTGRALAEEVMRHRNSGALTMEALLDKVGPDAPLTVFDIEHKKWWNDTKGHESLDTLLRKEAKFLNKLFPGLVAQNGNAIVVALPEGQQQAVWDALGKAFPQVDFTADTAVWAELDAVHGAANEERRKRGLIGHRKSAPSGIYREIRRLDRQIEAGADETGELQAQRDALMAEAQSVNALFDFQAPEQLTPEEQRALEKANNDRISEHYKTGDSYVRGLAGDLLDENGDVIDDPERIAAADVHLSDASIQRVQRMTPREAMKAFYLDAGGLPNWNGDDVLSASIGKDAIEYSSLDLSSMKDLNMILGREMTDRLLAAVSWFFDNTALGKFIVSHLHGDEYKAQSVQGFTEETLKKFVSRVANRLKRLTFVLERGNGDFVIVHGIGVQEGFGSTFAEADKNLEAKYSDKSLKPKYSISEIDFSDGQHTEEDISGLAKGGLSITTIKNFSGDPKQILLKVLSKDDVIDLLKWEPPNERVLPQFSRTNVNDVVRSDTSGDERHGVGTERILRPSADGALPERLRSASVSPDEGQNTSSGRPDTGRDLAGTEGEDSGSAGPSSGGLVSEAVRNRQEEMGGERGTQEAVQEVSSELRSGNRLGLNESTSDESNEPSSDSSEDTDKKTVLSQDTRGKTVISAKDGRKAFRLLLSDDADISTLAHEIAHIWFVQFADFAVTENASKAVKDDYRRILEFLGAKQGESFTEDQQEKFARGFELFLMEGDAPSREMERPFNRFKKWLGGIYRKIEFSYDVELNDNIRPVFQRMFATDRQARAYAEEAAGQPMPTIDGVNVSEFVDYLEKRAAAIGDLTREAEIRAYKEKLVAVDIDGRRRLQELVKSQRREIQDSPGYAVRQLIVAGSYKTSDGTEVRLDAPIRIKTSEVQKAYGLKYLPPTWRPFVNKDGLSFAELQQLPFFQNFSTPKELFDAIGEAPSQRGLWKEARRRADAIFQNEFKEKLDAAKGELKAKIEELAFGPALLRSLNDELKILSRADVSKEIYARARAYVEDTPLSELNPFRFMRESRRLDSRFRTEFALGNKKRAFGLKFNQAKNFAIATEIFQARERARRWQRTMDKLADEDFRKRIGKKDARFLDVLDALAEKLGIKPRTVSESQVKERAGVSDFVAAAKAHPAYAAKDAVAAAEMEVGFDPAIVQQVLDDPGSVMTDRDGKTTFRNRKFSELSPRQQENVHAVVVQAMRASRDFYELEIDGETFNVSSSEDAPGRNIFQVLSETMPKHFLTEKELHVNSADDTALDKARKAVFRFHVLHLEAAEKLKYLGPLGDSIMREMLKSEYRKNELGEKVLKRVQELFVDAESPLRMRGKETFELPANMKLPKNLSRTWKFADVLMMALNVGNASNLDRLLSGYGGEKAGWTSQNVFSFLNEHLTKADWDWVQSVWDLFSQDLYAETQRVYRAVNGIPMAQIEAVELETKHGTYRGGYFPIFYHPEMSSVGKNVDESSQSTTKSIRVTTSQGFTKARAAAINNAPLDLNFGRIFKNIASEVHYISHEETVRKLSNLFASEEFQRIVTERGGSVVKQAMIDLLQDFALGPDGAKLPDFACSLERAFYGMVIGATFGPAIGDVGRLAAAGVSGEVSLRGITVGTGMAVGFGREERNAIVSQSQYLKLLQDNVSSRFKSSNDTAAVAYNGSALDRWKLLVEKVNFGLLEFSTRFVGSALFVGAYTDAIREGMSEADAVKHADKVLIGWMPNAIDWTKTSFQNNPFGRIATVFAGEGMKNGVIARRLIGNAVGHFKEGDYIAAAAATVRAFGAIMALGLVSALVMGQGKDDDEDWDSWAARMMLTFIAGMDPVAVQSAPLISKELFGKGGNASDVPAWRTTKTMTKAGLQLIAPKGDRISPESLAALLDISGMTLHLPSNELKKVLMPAVGAQGHDPLTFKDPLQFSEDLTEAMIYGRSQKRGWNPISRGDKR